MKKTFQGLTAILAIILFGWGVYYATSPSLQEEADTSMTVPASAPASNTAKNEENPLPVIAVSKQSSMNSKSPTQSGEMHLAEPHPSAGKIPLPESEPVDLASQTMSIKKEESKSREILPGVTIKGGGVNVNLDKDDSRTLEVRPHSQTQLTLKQKF